MLMGLGQHGRTVDAQPDVFRFLWGEVGVSVARRVTPWVYLEARAPPSLHPLGARGQPKLFHVRATDPERHHCRRVWWHQYLVRFGGRLDPSLRLPSARELEVVPPTLPEDVYLPTVVVGLPAIGIGEVVACHDRVPIFVHERSRSVPRAARRDPDLSLG